MSYDVRIIRGADYSAKSSPKVSLEDWRAAVSQFPDFRHLRLKGADDDDPGVWQWVVSGSAMNFYLSGGDVVVSNPKRHDLQRMYQLAQILQAKVIGEADEIYDERGFPDRPTDFEPREQ